MTLVIIKIQYMILLGPKGEGRTRTKYLDISGTRIITVLSQRLGYEVFVCLVDLALVRL